jgi:hypothetical protein
VSRDELSLLIHSLVDGAAVYAESDDANDEIATALVG